jgi:hypothetical protein
MGTSVAQIDTTYGHLVPDSDAYLRASSMTTIDGCALAREH